ncbi:MAG: hypothetical protein Q8O83_00440 [bacterium]|nr:hypothetical protein [bacterium]
MFKKVNEIVENMTEADVLRIAGKALLAALILFAVGAMMHN